MSLNNSWSKSKSLEINVSSCSHLELHLVTCHSQPQHFNSLGVHSLVGKNVKKKALLKPLMCQVSSDCLPCCSLCISPLRVQEGYQNSRHLVHFSVRIQGKRNGGKSTSSLVSFFEISLKISGALLSDFNFVIINHI